MFFCRAAALRSRRACFVLYDDKNYRDRHYCIRPGETVPNLSNSRWKFNDKISSVQRLNSPNCVGYPAFYGTG